MGKIYWLVATNLQVNGVNVFLHGSQELGVIAGLEVISRHSNIQLVPGLESEVSIDVRDISISYNMPSVVCTWQPGE